MTPPKKRDKVKVKINELLSKPIKLDFIPQLKADLRKMHEWTIGELQKTVCTDDDASDSLQEIIDETFPQSGNGR